MLHHRTAIGGNTSYWSAFIETPFAIESRLKEQARSLGFELVGIAPATAADGFERLREWLDRGYAGEMKYLHSHAEARQHPASVMADVRSVIMVGLNYEGGRRIGDGGEDSDQPSGRVAGYAHGPDYHIFMWEKLDRLLEWLRCEIPVCNGRSVVDSAPLLERDFARRAGLGWFGKNTMLINKKQGSFFYLGALLVDIELQHDPPHDSSHCGTCTACLDACPTQAFTAPGWLDARRCISYLTIELRSPIPEDLRPGIGNWLFGCDVCQDVCPWNGKIPGARPQAAVASFDPIELLSLTDAEFLRRFRGTAIFRTKRRGLLRNAAIVLGNTGDSSALPSLRKALSDPEPLISEAAQWAIERIVRRSTDNSAAVSRFPVASLRLSF